MQASKTLGEFCGYFYIVLLFAPSHFKVCIMVSIYLLSRLAGVPLTEFQIFRIACIYIENDDIFCSVPYFSLGHSYALLFPQK